MQEPVASSSPSYDPTSFESPWVRALAPPLVIVLAVAVTMTPLGFLLMGFQIWIHEFGHATVAWVSGKRAIPLPIGWTNIAFERSMFVYFGILFLMGLLAWTGIRERKFLAIASAVAIVVVQWFMTWKVSEETARQWITFAGCGGELYLSAAMMALFYFKLPKKFRWGGCRYLFLFLGASAFYRSFRFWLDVKHGLEGIPYGSMVGGEDDQNGDMDTLVRDFLWTQHQIWGAYVHIGQACLCGLGIVYLIFACGLDSWVAEALAWCIPEAWKDRWAAGAGE